MKISAYPFPIDKPPLWATALPLLQKNLDTPAIIFQKFTLGILHMISLSSSNDEMDDWYI